ncbi:MAG: hypothetical protein CVU58_02225 [Deltaproteobacteria bacterium HGW-Deltaproteobacteria-16]|nr:MAG: hypothetical protein CVU58_02225 [Deltaproteobacteria bacterium HGW-Deltaproteobacteria-16]
MQTQAYFDDIQLHILEELRKATSSIHIAVAWFTDPDIFEQLCRKAGSGVQVEMIVVNDSINRKSDLQHERLRDLGGMCMMVGDNKKNATRMHNKFCVIDRATVITGSYNWSQRAQQNSENIIVTSDNPEFARQFIDEFEYLVEFHSAKGMRGADEWCSLGKTYLQCNQFAKAINAYQQAIRVDPKYVDAWYDLGYAYDDSNQHDKAIDVYQQAILIDPEM